MNNLKGLTYTEQAIVLMADMGKSYPLIASANKVTEETVKEVIERHKEREKAGTASWA